MAAFHRLMILLLKVAKNLTGNPQDRSRMQSEERIGEHDLLFQLLPCKSVYSWGDRAIEAVYRISTTLDAMSISADQLG
jgi:hypothetical protein